MYAPNLSPPIQHVTALTAGQCPGCRALKKSRHAERQPTLATLQVTFIFPSTMHGIKVPLQHEKLSCAGSLLHPWLQEV